MLTVGLVACRKEDAACLPTEAGADASDVTPRIKAFIHLKENGIHAKDVMTITLDSAEWYIEAGLNFSSAEAWKECSDFHLDSLEIELPLVNGGIANNDALDAYNTLRASITERVTPDENHLIMADVKFVQGSVSLITVKVLLQFGSGYNKANPGLITSYLANDFIYYGSGPFTNNTCGCGSNNNGATPCADIRIMQRVNAALTPLTYPCYYTNLESRGVNWMGNASNLTLNPPYTSYPTGFPATPYKLYICIGESCSGCLPPAHMSFYTQGMWDLMTVLKPTGKVPITTTVDDFLMVSTDTQRGHTALFSYGKLNCPR